MPVVMPTLPRSRLPSRRSYKAGSHILRLTGTTFTSRGSEIGFFECEMRRCYGVEALSLFAAFRLRAIPLSRPQPP